ncbi:MAG: hypothetical protein PHO30_08000, partial [Candidatus Omnitrophica bacterium]|nr:hypothetical protein [Candidatus Omnitrophota bacterium]
PWTLTETMTDGYYAVTAAEAVDIGDDYVRISSIGYCNNASRITELVVYLCGWKYLLLSMSDINFSVTSTGKSDGDIHANTVVSNDGGVTIHGTVTQGTPQIVSPAVLMEEYKNIATHVINGDYVFNGFDSFVDTSSPATSTYSDEIYYVTGKATINCGMRNLEFWRCFLIAEGGIEINSTVTDSGVDYVGLSRLDKTQENVIFQIKNNTGGPVTLTNMSVGWDLETTAYYESISLSVSGGTNYGTIWTYPPRAGNNEKVTLTKQPVIPDGAVATIQISNFSKSATKLQKQNMDTLQLPVTFWAGAKSYQTVVLKAGELPIPGKLLFRKQAQYPSLITKYGDITESGSISSKDRDFDGIIFSERGTVSFDCLKIEGCVVGNRIQFNKDIDLRYTPHYVLDPPPFFIGGIAILEWKELYY